MKDFGLTYLNIPDGRLIVAQVDVRGACRRDAGHAFCRTLIRSESADEHILDVVVAQWRFLLCGIAA
jgi:hypothetical protein